MNRCPASETIAPDDYTGTCPVCGNHADTTALGHIAVHMNEQRYRYTGKHRRATATAR